MIRGETFAAADTFAFGRQLAGALFDGAVVCLSGDLGAGKTVMAQGLAAGLGIADAVTSPTFTVLNVYGGERTLYHFDLYRLERPEELDDIGFYEYSRAAAGVTVIEWPEKFPAALPDEYLWVEIKYGGAPDSRVVTIRAQGEQYRALYGELKQSCPFLH